MSPQRRNFGVAIMVGYPTNRAGDAGARNPRYGLGNLIENAVDFTHTRSRSPDGGGGQHHHQR